MIATSAIKNNWDGGNLMSKKIIILFFICGVLLIGCTKSDISDKTSNGSVTIYEELSLSDDETTYVIKMNLNNKTDELADVKVLIDNTEDGVKKLMGDPTYIITNNNIGDEKVLIFIPKGKSPTATRILISGGVVLNAFTDEMNGFDFDSLKRDIERLNSERASLGLSVILTLHN